MKAVLAHPHNGLMQIGSRNNSGLRASATICQYHFDIGNDVDPSTNASVWRKTENTTSIHRQSVTQGNECPFTLIVDTLAYASRILGDGLNMGSFSH
eukprot:10978785-Karenia_brevis.AAC.1